SIQRAHPAGGSRGAAWTPVSGDSALDLEVRRHPCRCTLSSNKALSSRTGRAGLRARDGPRDPGELPAVHAERSGAGPASSRPSQPHSRFPALTRERLLDTQRITPPASPTKPASPMLRLRGLGTQIAGQLPWRCRSAPFSRATL